MGADNESLSGHSLAEERNLLERLDHPRMTKTILVIVALLMLTGILEGFDVGIIAPVILILKTLWHPSARELGILGSTGTFGVVLGVLPGGWLADLYGRKKIMLLGIAIFSLFTLVSAAAQNAYQIAAFRFIAGLGSGAVYPMPYLFVAEFVNKKRRGQVAGYTSCLFFGYLLESFVGSWVVHTVAPGLGWRLLFVVGGAAILFVPILWKWLPESPRFLLKKGRVAEVRAFVERLEDEAGLSHDVKIIDEPALSVQGQPTERRMGLRALLQPPYLKRCFVSYCALGAPFVCFYVSMIYGPMIFNTMGVSKVDAMLYAGVLNVIAFIGNITQAQLGDRMGRRPAMVIWMLLGVVALVTLGQHLHLPIAVLILAAVALWFFGVSGFSVPKIYVTEQFPTALRGTGTALGDLTTRFLIGVVLVYYIPTMMAAFGLTTLTIILGILVVLLLLPLVFWGIETAGRSIEETASDHVTVADTPDDLKVVLSNSGKRGA